MSRAKPHSRRWVIRPFPTTKPEPKETKSRPNKIPVTVASADNQRFQSRDWGATPREGRGWEEAPRCMCRFRYRQDQS